MAGSWYNRLSGIMGRASDIAHRVTVVTLAGGSLYMLGGAFYTIVLRSRANQQKLEQFIEEKQKEEASK